MEKKKKKKYEKNLNASIKFFSECCVSWCHALRIDSNTWIHVHPTIHQPIHTYANHIHTLRNVLVKPGNIKFCMKLNRVKTSSLTYYLREFMDTIMVVTENKELKKKGIVLWLFFALRFRLLINAKDINHYNCLQ